MNPHGGQDWASLVIVLGIGALCLAVSWMETREWFRRGDLELQRIIDEALDRAEPDHVDCANPDCEQVICACRKPAECDGCTTLGCDHLNRHGGLLCWDCRVGCCSECAAETAAEVPMDWAGGR